MESLAPVLGSPLGPGNDAIDFGKLATAAEIRMNANSKTGDKLKIAWVISPLVARGGGFDILRGWIKHLPEDRFDLMLVYYSWERERVEEALAPWPHVRLVHVPQLHSPGALFVPAVRALADIFEQERPDVVHSVMVQGDILGSIAARRAGVPLILSTAIGYLVAHTAPWKAVLYRLGLRLARRRIDQVLAISGATRTQLVEEFGFPADRVRVVYCGIELGETQPERVNVIPRLEAPLIGLVGELILEKGAQHLLQAVPEILEAHPGARFRIVGDGDYRPSLEALAASLGIEDRVDFTGWLASGRRAIEEFDIFVFASEPGYDGLPRVLLEAWDVGTPFVTTNVAVVPEIVRDGVDGLVIPPKDPRAIAAAVNRLLGDPSLWTAVRNAGLARAPEFGVKHEVELLREVYESVVDHKREVC